MDLLIHNILKQNMQYLSTRQSVLSDNIANANTPNYKAQDVEKPSFEAMVKRSSQLTPVRTDANHMQLKGASASPFTIGDDRSAFETTMNGNSVNLEDQMVKMNQTASDYRVTTTIYRKMGDMMRLATSGNSGG